MPYAVTNAAAATSGSTQDITSAGFDPNGVMVTVSGGSTLGSAANTSRMCIGFADGSNDYCMAAVSRHGAPTSNELYVGIDGFSICILNDDGTVNGLGSISLITDGIRITWEANPDTGFQIGVAMWGGDWTFVAHRWEVRGAEPTQDLFHGAGVSADAAIGARPHSSTGAAGVQTCASVADVESAVGTGAGIGLGLWDGTTQRGGFIVGEHGQSTSDVTTTYGPQFGRACSDQGYGDGGETISSHPDGATITFFGGARQVGVCCTLAWEGAGSKSVSMDQIATPTSTDNQSTTLPGFEPGLVITQASCQPSEGRFRGSYNDQFSTGMFTASDAFSCNIENQDGAATTVTRSTARTIPISADNPVDGDVRAAFVSMDANGWTLNFTHVHTGANIVNYLSFEVDDAAAPEPVTGTLAATLPLLGMSASGTVTPPPIVGTMATALPLLALDASGTVAAQITGTAAMDLPLLGMAASGTATTTITGALATTLPLLSLSATGTVAIGGALAADLPLLTLSASGVVSTQITGTLATDLPLLSLQASGFVTSAIVGTLTTDLPLLGMAAAGTVAHVGTLVADLPLLGLDAVGTATTSIEGTLSVDLPLLGMAATGFVAENIAGVMATALPLLSLSAAGTVTARPVGPMATSVPLLTMAASGATAHNGPLVASLPLLGLTASGWVAASIQGPLAATLPLLDLSAAGTVVAPAADIQGPLAATLPLIGMAASGAAITSVVGTLSANLPLLGMSAAGTPKTTGGLATALPLLTLSAAGLATSTLTGTLTASLPLMGMLAFGGRGAVGTMAASLPLPALAATGTAATGGALVATLPLLALDAAGVVTSDISGALSATLPLPAMSAGGFAIRIGTLTATLPLPVMDAIGIRNTTAVGTLVTALPLLQMSATGALQAETQTVCGPWSTTTVFEACDQFRVLFSGAQPADDIQVRIEVEFEVDRE